MEKNLELLWVAQLRWVALAAHVFLVVAISAATDLEVPIGPLLLLLAAGGASNLALLKGARSNHPRALIGVALAFDIGILTMGLHLSGGPMNPFSFLYVVPVALGAVVLSARSTALLCLLSIGGYGLLYASTPHDNMHHHGSMQLHLEGMWVAMSASALLVAYFVVALQRKLHERESELEEARNRAARYDKLASLTTLAAGAAHELATPLSTIAVTSKELEIALEATPELATEARIIREETKRCRSILQRLSSRSGEQLGEANQRVEILALMTTALGRVSAPNRIEIRGPEQVLDIPVESITESITALFQNALDASDDAVEVSWSLNSGFVEIRVKDRGPGVPDDALERLFEPFYSTKDHPNRMGLGLFVARKVAEELGGTLVIKNEEEGTVATLRIVIPEAATR